MAALPDPMWTRLQRFAKVDSKTNSCMATDADHSSSGGPPPRRLLPALIRAPFFFLLLLYVGGYVVADVTGEYRLTSDNNGIWYWVWRGAGEWNAADRSPTALGVAFFPLRVLDNYLFDRHVALIASVPRGDGVWFEYPGLGLTWGEGETFQDPIQVPGDTSIKAREAYERVTAD